MVLKLYRIFSGFVNVADSLSLSPPSDNEPFKEIWCILPEEYRISFTHVGMTIFDAAGNDCTPVLSGDMVQLVSSKEQRALKCISKPSKFSLKELRYQMQYSQKQVADALGINIRHYQKIEAGDINLRKVEAGTLVELADLLGVDIHELL